jgi:hypothetical protein
MEFIFLVLEILEEIPIKKLLKEGMVTKVVLVVETRELWLLKLAMVWT